MISTCVLARSDCVNLVGKFECTCKDNYFKDSDGQCVDKDECADESHNCGMHSDCINDDDGYHCKCKSGYQGKRIK